MNLFMYWGSSTIVLRSYGAQVVTANEAPELYEMVDRLRRRAGLPMPTVAIAPQEQASAFATGRNPENAVVCVTQGIVRTLSKEELEGVIAHELAQIKNDDMLLQTIAAPIAAMLIQFAISRQREFKADAVGAQISGRPLSLASALVKLEIGARRIPMHVSPSAAPLAIVNPLAAFSLRGASKLFSMHPPTEERVEALQQLSMQ